MTDSNENKPAVNIPTMVAENMGASIKSLVLQEMRAMPNVWPKMNETQQHECIERIERQIRLMAASAANTMASGEMVSVKGHIDQINLKDKIKLTVMINASNHHNDLVELYQSTGNDCRVVLCDSDQFVGGMDLVEIAEPDQQKLDLDADDDLLWCVVVPMRSGKSIVPAPSHKMAEVFARRCREVLMEHDNDLAASVYAMPWQDNKAAHARNLKNKGWEMLQEWYKKLKAGDIKAEVVALIGHNPEPNNDADSSENSKQATKVAESSDNGSNGESEQDKEEERKRKKREYDKARRASKNQ